MQDIKPANWVYTADAVTNRFFDVPAHSIHFIDFGSARVLPSGLGSGVQIFDYAIASGTPPHPPEGMDVLDPYAVDIFKLGAACHWFITVSSGHLEARNLLTSQ